MAKMGAEIKIEARMVMVLRIVIAWVVCLLVVIVVHEVQLSDSRARAPDGFLM
jgi:hypothetical protein